MKKITNLALIIIMIGAIIMPLFTYAKSSDKPKENFANVIFLAYFKGDTEGKEYLEKNTTKIMEMYNGTNELAVKGYLNKVSYGKFNLKNIFPQYDGTKIIPFELPFTSDGLDKNNLDYQIIDNIVDSIKETNEIIDYNNDGFIDNVSIILKGGTALAESNSTFVSHKSDYGADKNWSNKKIGTYNMLNTYTLENNGAGVITHEFLHSLGYPDLYTSTPSSYPVYTWDIMGGVSKNMSYPLAYLRMKYTNWLTIDTITTSQTLTLNTQDDPNGNQAYILKSPLNEYELFVVEFRKKSEDMDHLDRVIGHSGVIIYRVDTTVTGLSNNKGKTGIYVFREESGKKDDSTLRNEIYNAAYSKEAGKTSIGSSDLNITKSALTYSDGTNSGIVIKNISSSEGNTMTLDVTIPDVADYDIWKDTKFKDETGENEYLIKNIDTISYDDKLYTVSIGNNKIYTHTYDKDIWTNINISNIENSNNLTKASLLNLDNELYLLVSTFDKIILYKYSNGWNKVTEMVNNNGSYAYKILNHKIYLTVNTESQKASLYELNNNKFELVGIYYQGNSRDLIGTTAIENINNKTYVTCRQANNKIRLYELQDKKFKEIPNTMNANQYDVVSLNNKMYFVLGSDTNNKTMRMVAFDGTNFETINTNIELGDPKVTVSQGNLYILATEISETQNGKTILYAYNEKKKEIEQEGKNVDNAASAGNLSLTSIKNKIYVMLRRKTDGVIVVKEKETVNSLKSLSIVPPKKTTYIVGEKLDVTGMKVTANYTKEQKEIKDYTISGFDSTKPGEYNVTVTYGGISNTFSYTIVAKAQNNTTLKEYLTKANYKIENEFTNGFVVGETINNIKNKLQNKDINIKTSTNIISTGTEISYGSEKYTVVIYGDINGDGKINSADLLKMRQHLIGTLELKGSNKKAAALVNGNTINSADLLKLRQHLLGINNIKQ